MAERATTYKSRANRLWPDPKSSAGDAPLGVVVPPGSGLLFTSGIVARDPEGNTIYQGNFEMQARTALDYIRLLVTEAGGSMESIVKVNAYLRHGKDFGKLQELRREYWPNEPPAFSALQVKSLWQDFLVEIAVIAIVPE